MSELIVYSVPPSLYCAKLRILLRHKDLQWQEQAPPGGYGSAHYKTIVFSGNMPALVDGDLLIGDSEAIAEYLNEKHPTPLMLPVEISTRANCRERSRFHDTRLEPQLRRSFAHIAPAGRDSQVLSSIEAELNIRLQQYDQMLIAHAPDTSTLTLADCGFPISFAWIEALTPVLGFSIEWPKSVLQWRESIEQFPAVTTELTAYLPVLEKYVKEVSAG